MARKIRFRKGMLCGWKRGSFDSWWRGEEMLRPVIRKHYPKTWTIMHRQKTGVEPTFQGIYATKKEAFETIRKTICEGA